MTAMTLYQFQPQLRQMLLPVAKQLKNWKLNPNHMTYTAMIFSLVIGLVLCAEPNNRAFWFFMPLILVIRLGLNTIDGVMAEELNMRTNYGAILNEMSEIISDIAIYLPFFFINQANNPLVFIFIIVCVLVEFMGLAAYQVCQKRSHHGPFGKYDRTLFMMAIAIHMALASIPSRGVLNGLLALGVVLGIWTISRRFKAALQRS